MDSSASLKKKPNFLILEKRLIFIKNFFCERHHEIEKYLKRIVRICPKCFC